MSKLSPKGVVNFNDSNNNGRFVEHESMSFSQKRELIMQSNIMLNESMTVASAAFAFNHEPQKWIPNERFDSC
jgi:hypothetical protein